MKKVNIIILFIGIILFSSCTSKNSIVPQESSTVETAVQTQEANKTISLSDFQGKWEGKIVRENISDIWTINIDSEQEKVLNSSVQAKYKYLPVNWVIENEKLVITMNDEDHRITITLNVPDNEDILNGNFVQHGIMTDVTFSKISANIAKL